MDALITALIALMPLFAIAPLAIGAVAVVALLVSPRLRQAVGEWARRRLGVERSPRGVTAAGARAHSTDELRAEVHRLAQRVEFLERMLVEPPRDATRATPRHS